MQRGDRRGIAQQAERERRHLADFRIGIDASTGEQRRHAGLEAHAPDPERRAPANAGVRVDEHAFEADAAGRVVANITWPAVPAPGATGPAAAAAPAAVFGVTQDPVVFEPQDRADLLFERDARLGHHLWCGVAAAPEVSQAAATTTAGKKAAEGFGRIPGVCMAISAPVPFRLLAPGFRCEACACAHPVGRLPR